MRDKSTRTTLRDGIDTTVEQIGAEIVADIPDTPTEVREQLPDDLSEVLAAADAKGDVSLQRLITETPLEEILDDAGSLADRAETDK